MTILFTNNASTSLASGISSSATSLTVVIGAGSLFPTITGSNIFYLTLQNQSNTTPIEIVKVTARSGDTMTIVRAQDNTTASAFNAGDKVELRLPAIVLQDFPQLDVTNTFTVDQSISGLTVGKGGGSVAQNTVSGASALGSNTSGSYNSAFGYASLFSNTTGVSNTGIGASTFNSNTTGSYNVGIGALSLYSNTTASNSTAVGYQAGYSHTTGGSNSYFGTSAGYSTTTGYYNVASGNNALYYTTTGASNTAIGVSALQSNTTASNNTAVGYQAGYTGTTGNSNAYLGYQAGYLNNASQNAFVGYQAGYNSTCNYATAIGYQAGYNNTDGTYGNVFIGWTAGKANTSGGANTFIGSGSGSLVTTGGKNSILGGYNGNQGGLDIRTASNYIVLSDGDGNPRQTIDGSGNIMFATTSTSTTGSNYGVLIRPNFSTTGDTLLWIGSSQSTSAYNSYNLWSGGASAYRFYVDMAGTIHATSTSISAISDASLKTNVKDLETGLTEVMALKPRRFDWINGDGTNVAGFIAQEVQTVLPDLVQESLYSHNEDGTNITKLNLKMGDILPTLVKAIQELKAEVDSLKQQLGK